jgi:hypothetical protein
LALQLALMVIQPQAALANEPSLEQDAIVSSAAVLFIENAGQWDEGARFRVRGGGAGTSCIVEPM